ncbi:hypothetical protein [Burkholderia cepacia]|uniref:hypothetical protein n=1 Tax=Burkholderia cepacia TaxID=292 RepID=UPI001FC8CC87|nr:hypothetical protein [Burkholderia cepacia]
MTDFIDYCFGGGALSLVAARWAYTGKLHKNQRDPGIEASLKSRTTDSLEVKLKEAVHRVGELSMEVEILRMERERQECRPLTARRSST